MRALTRLASGHQDPDHLQVAVPTAAITHLDGGHALVTLAGDLDLAAVPMLRAVLGRAQGCQQVVIDAGAVTFIDCAALRPLLALARQAAAGGGHLVVRDAAPPLARLITWCALEGDLPTEQRAPHGRATRRTPTR